MASDDYELLPQQVIQDLKYEVEALKKRLSAPDAKINELILEIESLKESIHDLHSIFQQALEQVKGDDDGHHKKLEQATEKIDNLLVQNETIAKGMVAIADKVDEFVMRQNKMPSQNMPSESMNNMPNTSYTPQMSMGMPMMGGMTGPSRMAPTPNFNDLPPLTPSSSAADDDDFPPPPPGLTSGPKRRGLFK